MANVAVQVIEELIARAACLHLPYCAVSAQHLMKRLLLLPTQPNGRS